MKKRFRIIALSLSLLFFLFCAAPPAEAEVSPADPGSAIAGVRIGELSVSAKSALLMEAETGTVLYAKTADERLPMASTTKIMTALVALDLSNPAAVITVPREAVGIEGSSVYLFEGEQLTLEQLLYALLLSSANDAAAAIAYGTAGGIEQFAARMNEKAAALGLRDTHFMNPHGLDHEEHYTTARELAIITRAALEHPLIRTIVATRKATIPHNGQDGVRLLVNHNKLLRLYEGAVGVKTGFTKRSGRCLVSAAKRGGVTLIAVTLQAPNDWNDHKLLLDSGFASIESVLLCEAGACRMRLPIVGGTAEEITVSNSSALRVLLPSGHGAITSSVEMPHFRYAPVQAGETVGQAVFRCDGAVVGTVALTAEETVAQKPHRRNFFQWLWDALFRR